MAKKTIQDLKILDTIFLENTYHSPIQCEVDLISTTELRIQGKRYSIVKEDRTSYIFTSVAQGYSRAETFFLNKIDALKNQRTELDKHFEKRYEEQQSFLEIMVLLNKKSRLLEQEISELIRIQ